MKTRITYIGVILLLNYFQGKLGHQHYHLSPFFVRKMMQVLHRPAEENNTILALLACHTKIAER